MSNDVLDGERARYWVDRWDRQQECYLPDREERFAVIGDVLERTIERSDPLIVDLGVGPGSLAERILTRFLSATVVGVDADPLLVALAELTCDQDRFRAVHADLREDHWWDLLELERPPDAFVSTTALHWMNRLPLRDLLRRCAHALPPGGVFLNGDHMCEGENGPRLDKLGKTLKQRRAGRTGIQHSEDWRSWWRAVEQAPELASLLRARDGGFDHTICDSPTIEDHVGFLRAAGFSEAGVLWQVGDDRIVAGIR